MHVASVVASQLTRLVHGSNAGIYENESRSGEMLAAGCAVGVACTFSAPIGGVLFSIEVTSVYFAVRNYWRGFFAATCSATIFRILRMFSASAAVTVEAHYQTNFPPQNVFLPQELPVFALVGSFGGGGGRWRIEDEPLILVVVDRKDENFDTPFVLFEGTFEGLAEN